jgi:hypothetical protein
MACKPAPIGEHSLPLADAAAIKKQIPQIKTVSPNVDGSVQVIYGNKNWFTRDRGVLPEYFGIKRWDIDQGRRSPKKTSRTWRTCASSGVQLGAAAALSRIGIVAMAVL